MKKLRIVLAFITIASLITGIAVFLLTGGLEHDVTPLVALGERYLEEGDYEEAALQFEKAIAISEKSPEAWYGFARASIGLGKEDEAIKALKKVAQLDSSQKDKVSWMIEKIKAGEGMNLILLSYGELEQTTDATEADNSGSDDVMTNSEVLAAYAAGFPMLTGEEFSVSVRQMTGETYVTSKSGCFGYYMTPDGTLVAANYVNATNTLEIETFRESDYGDVRECAKIESLISPIDWEDEEDLRVAYAALPNGKAVVVIEHLGWAYTYADGGVHDLELIEISEDGQLTSVFHHYEAGSDWDDTEANKALTEFNSVTGCNYSIYFAHGGKLESMFTDDTMCVKFAAINYMSDSAKANDSNVWQTMQEYGEDARYPWGTGTFTLKN